MAALIRFFRRRKKDRPDFSEQRFLHDGHSPQHDVHGKLKFHKNDIECKVIHLDGQEMTTYLNKKAVGRELYDRVFTNFDFTQEFDYFGLQYMDTSNVAQWLDPTKKIRKQLSIGPPYTLHLRVRFFSSEPQILRDELTRYLFVMQLKDDIRSGKLKCDEELGSELAALCLQSELGDFDEETHSLTFISQFRFMPDHLQTEDFEKSTLEHYMDFAGRNMTPAAADKAYLDKARYLPDYGVDTHCVTGKDDQVYSLGLTPNGILVYDNKQKIGFFFWPWIIKIGFSKTKLKIIVAEKDDETGVTRDHSFVFTLADPRACKHLWKCCVECHSFFRLTSNNQGPGKGSAKLLRMQSRFYSSYRTEFEMRHANMGSSHRRSARFQRVPSRRFSSRASFEKAEALSRKGDPSKTKAEKRAELKADTLRRLQSGGDTATAAAVATSSSSTPREPSTPTLGATAAGDETPTIPRESLGSTGSSASRTHRTFVSVEAKVEAPPVRGTAGVVGPAHPSSSSSSEASMEEERPVAALVKGQSVEGGETGAVFEEAHTRLVPSHIPKSIAMPARTAVGHASLRSAFKPTRLQEESTDEEGRQLTAHASEEPNSQIPILSRSSSAAANATVTPQPQVSSPSDPPSLIPRQTSTTAVSASSLPRPRPSATNTAAPAPPAAAASGVTSRIPKITGPAPLVITSASSPPPISSPPAVSPQPMKSSPAASPPPISSASTANSPPIVPGVSPPPTAGASLIPQPRRPSGTTATQPGPAKAPAGSRIPALVSQPPTVATNAPRRSASAVSTSSSASSSSSSSQHQQQQQQQQPSEKENEEQKEEKEGLPPPTRIPSLPRPPRGEVKAQFQVETSFASASVSTSHKLLPSNVRPTVQPLAKPNLVLVKRAGGHPNGHQGLRNNPVQEQLYTTV